MNLPRSAKQLAADLRKAAANAGEKPIQGTLRRLADEVERLTPPQLSYDEAEHDSQVPPVPSSIHAWWAGVLG